MCISSRQSHRTHLKESSRRSLVIKVLEDQEGEKQQLIDSGRRHLSSVCQFKGSTSAPMFKRTHGDSLDELGENKVRVLRRMELVVLGGKR